MPSDVRAAVAADVDRPQVVVLIIVIGRRLALVDVSGLPGERVVDDGEFEAFAAMDRQHLDRLGVGVEPQRAIFVRAVPIGGGDSLAKPGRQRSCAELLLGRDGVQKLADVSEVGQPALAPKPPEDSPRDSLGRRDRLSKRAATPRLRSRPAQRWNFAWRSSQADSSAAAICSALQPRKEVSAAERARTLETGRSTASSSRSHSSAAGVANTLPAPLITAGTPARSSAPSTSAASLFVGTRTAMCRGRTGSRP